MKVRKLMNKVINKVLMPEENKKIKEWNVKLEHARLAYSSTLDGINTNEKIYERSREVKGNPNANVTPSKVACHTIGIAYELIESQVDNSVPMPKVIPVHEEDEEVAKTIEKALINMIKTRRVYIINDLMERTVPIQGGDFFHV